MYYVIYQTTNLINGNIYIGKHKTKDPYDSYLGSGKYLNRAIDYYGRDNFRKDILCILKDEQSMNEKEKELVTKEFCNRSDTYNLCPGGHGGFGYINSNPNHFLTEKRINALNKGPTKKSIENIQLKHKNDIQYQNIVKKNIEYVHILYPEGTFKGKKHSEETKIKMSKAHNEIHNGGNNSQYNTMWVSNGYESKKIKIDDEIPQGWRKGRNLKRKLCKSCGKEFLTHNAKNCSKECQNLSRKRSLRNKVPKNKINISEEVIQEIITMNNQGQSLQKLARKYNINKHTIYDIINRYKNS